MKKSVLFSLIVVVSLMLIAQAGRADLIDIVSDGGSAATADEIGHVTLSDDGTDLTIVATLTTGHSDVVSYPDTIPPSQLANLYITEAHIHISTVEPTQTWDPNSTGKQVKNGNPRPGHFAYNNLDPTPLIVLSGDNADSPQTATLTVPSPSGDAYIAVHLEIAGDFEEFIADEWVDGEGDESETGWAEGTDFVGKNWATYIEHTDVVPTAPGRSSTMATRWGAMKTK